MRKCMEQRTAMDLLTPTILKRTHEDWALAGLLSRVCFIVYLHLVTTEEPCKLAVMPITVRRHLYFQVASICKPFSHFKQDEAFEVLDTAIAHAEDAARGAQISLAEYNPASQAHQSIRDSLGFRTHAEIVAHAGKELALRCCMSDPHAHDKEASKRELISPVIFAAAALIGVYHRILTIHAHTDISILLSTKTVLIGGGTPCSF